MMINTHIINHTNIIIALHPLLHHTAHLNQRILHILTHHIQLQKVICLKNVLLKHPVQEAVARVSSCYYQTPQQAMVVMEQHFKSIHVN